MTNYACYDKPSRLCQLPCKSRTVDHILFEKEIDFCMTFVSAIGRSGLWVGILGFTYM